jgi:hypothetical protein
MSKVITWQSPSGATIDVTPAQEAMLQAAGVWPRDESGGEYCSVSHGLHHGEPTFTDAELRADVGIAAANAIIIEGVGEPFDLPDDASSDPEMEWYGTVRVNIDDVVYGVGVVLGVRESDRDSCRASGGSVRPFLSAWYADASDWMSARASNGTTGLPKDGDMPREVLERIQTHINRLWNEATGKAS